MEPKALRPDVDDSIRRHPSSLAPPERHRRFGPWGILATVVSALALLAGGLLLFLAVGDDDAPGPGAVGAQAPGFDLRSLDGRNEVRLSELRGRVVVVAFERPNCRACRRSEAALDRAWRRFRDEGVAVMGIRRNPPPVGANVGATPGPWPVLADPHGRTAAAYGVQDRLETFVIDEHGKVVAAMDGPVTVPVLAAQLALALGVATTTEPSAASPEEPSSTS
jgi:peroxiredoxin